MSDASAKQPGDALSGNGAPEKTSGPTDLHELHELHTAQPAQDGSDPFPAEVLPDKMRRMVRTIAHHRQMPVTLPSVCSLGVVSAAIGKGLRVRGLDYVTTPANLYILASAESGIGKGLGSGPICQPLYDYEENPDIRLTCENTTSEALARALADNNECLASISADARDVIENLCGRYLEKGKTDEGLLLKAFSWEQLRVDRVTSGKVHLRRPCLTVLWLVQPDKIDLMFAQKSLLEGGLLPRFLTCQAHWLPQKLDRSRGRLPEDVIAEWNALVTGIIKVFRSKAEPSTVECDEGALSVFDDYHEVARQRQIGPEREFSSFAARWHEQSLRIGLVLHVATHGADALGVRVSQRTAEAAVRITEWFVQQQLKILRRGIAKAREELEAKVFALFTGPRIAIIATDVYRERIVPNAKEAHALLNDMVLASKLTYKDEKPTHGGHTTRFYSRAPRA